MGSLTITNRTKNDDFLIRMSRNIIELDNITFLRLNKCTTRYINCEKNLF